MIVEDGCYAKQLLRSALRVGSGIAAERPETLTGQLSARLPLETTLDALVARHRGSSCIAEGCNIVLVHDHLG
jgi:hypothetical protein